MKKATRYDELEDLVATLGQGFLGLTINCARCHDHKFDPISQKEYYQVAALLAGVNQEEKERSGIGLSPTEDQPDFSGTAHVIIPRQPPVMALLERGDYRKPREVVAPAALKALSGVLGRLRPGAGRTGGGTPRGAGPLAERPGEPADGPGLRQPGLVPPLRPGDRRHAERLRLQRRPAEPSRAARLPGLPVHGGRLEGQGPAPADRHLGHLPAGVAGGERGGRGRRLRQPPPLAGQPASAGGRGVPRRGAVGRRRPEPAGRRAELRRRRAEQAGGQRQPRVHRPDRRVLRRGQPPDDLSALGAVGEPADARGARLPRPLGDVAAADLDDHADPGALAVQ